MFRTQVFANNVLCSENNFIGKIHWANECARRMGKWCGITFHLQFGVEKLVLQTYQFIWNSQFFNIDRNLACVESAKILSQWKHCRDIKLMHTLGNLVMPMQIKAKEEEGKKVLTRDLLKSVQNTLNAQPHCALHTGNRWIGEEITENCVKKKKSWRALLH